MTPARALGSAAVVVLFGLTACGDGSQRRESDEVFSEARFRDPPREFAPRVRWWWPGGAVEDEVVRASLREIAAAGYGGVELQTLVLGLSEAEVAADPRIRTVGTPSFLEHVRVLSEEARALGLGWDLTLGSGWPSGDPAVDAEAERQLLLATQELSGPILFSGPLPPPEEPAWVAVSNTILPVTGPFDQAYDLVAVLGAPVIDGMAEPPVLGAATDLSAAVDGDRLEWSVPAGHHALLAVYENRTSHLVLGAAFPGRGADARVVDHLDPAGLAAVLALQGDPWLDALGDRLPQTVFVDSFELVGDLPWTTDFAQRFERETGYSIVPYLPFVFRRAGEAFYAEVLQGETGPRFASEDPIVGERAREDYEAVREVLFAEAFVAPLRSWAERRRVAVRLQAHGGWGDVIDDYGTAHVPESEGLYARGSFDFLRLAASAAHISGARHASSESFVLVHLRGTAPLELDELWLLTGRAFAAGITRLVHHGVAYPYARAGSGLWYPFRPGEGVVSAGPVPITSEIRPGEGAWAFLPALNQAQARLSYALSRGRHRAEVAWLFAERQQPNTAFIVGDQLPPEQGESATSLALRRAGYVYDRVSRRPLATSSAEDGTLRVGEASYRALLVTDLPVAEPELMEAIEQAVAAGVTVVVVGELPSRAPGLRQASVRDARVRSSAARLAQAVALVAAPEEVPAALAARGVAPALLPLQGETTLSVEHREVASGDLFFVFNESYADAAWRVRLTMPAGRVRILDPESGDGETLATVEDANGTSFELQLPATRGRVLYVTP